MWYIKGLPSSSRNRNWMVQEWAFTGSFKRIAYVLPLQDFQPFISESTIAIGLSG